MDFFRRQNWDLVGRSWVWLSISGVMFLAGLIAWAALGLNLGIDFTGGGLVRYGFTHTIATDRAEQVRVVQQVREALTGVDLEQVQVLVSGQDELLIRTPLVANDEAALAQERLIREQVERLFGAQYGPIEALGRESVGPVVGEQLRRSAMNALILGCFLILLYITIRYEFRFAIAAVIALVHDVFILIGFMALFRLELDSSFVAVILTVIGFSVHDTIVIFDRIRENMKLHRRADFAATVNASLLQTMARSLYTGVAVLFTLAALGIFSTGSIRVFSIAMVLGIALGSYSSIFNASQIIVVWERFRASKQAATGGTAVRRRERARLTGGAATVEVAEVGDEEGAEDEEAPAAGARRLSATEALARAEEAAQEEKRAERRERRKATKGKGKGKRRF